MEILSVNEYKDATGRVRYLAVSRHAAGAGSLTKSASNFVNEYKIDYVITHEAPLSARGQIARVKRIDEDYTLPAILQSWYEEIRSHGRMRKWYFGHMHTDQEISPTLRAVYNNVLEIETEERVRWA